MKRSVFLCALLALLLCGCSGITNPPTITVSLVETEGCYIPANGQRVRPGEDVSFELVLEEGYAFASVAYDGEYRFEIRDGKEYLRLVNVRYPTRARLTLTDQYRTIHYDPNGGQGDAVTRSCDVSVHLRPNTSIGTDLFRNPGHTLLGWNTEPDGSGLRIGLGSRVSVSPEETLKLYAQWVPWSGESDFRFTAGDSGTTVTGYTGTDDPVVVPEYLDGKPVSRIAAGAFRDCGAGAVVLPKTLRTVEDGAFVDCALRELTLFDNVEVIGSGCFSGCSELSVLHINAIEPPYGYEYRRESCLADKVDLLIQARGQRKLVFYGGCSMWYNLDSQYAQYLLGDRWQVVNMGLNGVVNSAVQMRIITEYLEPGDVFFHTPELSSRTQLMSEMALGPQDDKLWCGLEYNYDLVAHVDLREFPTLLDTFCQWLDKKTEGADYSGRYVDGEGRTFLDEMGGIPFPRERPAGILPDGVWLDPAFLEPEAMARLAAYYRAIADKGAHVYVSYACVNLDAVPENQQGNVARMDAAFRACIDAMDEGKLVSRLEDYLYRNGDFYDTNYHLLSEAARENTQRWLRDLRAQMEQDGLWNAET